MQTAAQVLDTFTLRHPIEGLRPADYNPRRITPEAETALKRSITLIGFAKPVLAMPNGLIIAGHQRTNAARGLGWTHVPAYILKNVKEGDQIRFNQLHNGTDLDAIDKPVYLPTSNGNGYELIDWRDIDGDLRSKGAETRSGICKLISLYGPWGAVTATQSGIVLSSPHYALACKILQMPLRVFRVPDSIHSEAAKLLTDQYGEFSYDHIPRNTYMQAFAQLSRLRGDFESNGFRNLQSRLYQMVAIKHLKKTDRILDFGCGRGDYVTRMKALGYRIWGLEFNFRSGESIDRKKSHELIDAVISEWATNGPFDTVICDSVMNSVDSQQAEDDILTCINALCRIGGDVFLSGRTRECITADFNKTKCAQKTARDRGEFLDTSGMSAFFRKGNWFFQKFHTKEQVMAMGPRFFGDNMTYYNCGNQRSWQTHCKNNRYLAANLTESSLRREFNLPWPGGQTVGRADAAVAAWRLAQEKI